MGGGCTSIAHVAGWSVHLAGHSPAMPKSTAGGSSGFALVVDDTRPPTIALLCHRATSIRAILMTEAIPCQK